jgi:hypothetical protein
MRDFHILREKRLITHILQADIYHSVSQVKKHKYNEGEDDRNKDQQITQIIYVSLNLRSYIFLHNLNFLFFLFIFKFL